MRKKLMMLVVALICILLPTMAVNLGENFSVQAISSSSQESTDYEIDCIPIEKVEVFTASNSIMPGEKANLSIKVFPSYAIDTAKSITYQIINGDQFATINKNVLTAKVDIAYGGIVTVEAVVDGVYSNNTVEILVELEPNADTFIAVDYVDLQKNTGYIFEGAKVNIFQILSTQIYPSNSTIQNTVYAITQGEEYAKIRGSYIHVNDNLADGNLAIKICALVADKLSNEVEIKLYVPAKSIKLQASNDSPMSSTKTGDEVELSTEIVGVATKNEPTFKILSGANLIEGNFVDGSIIPEKFSVKPNLTAYHDLNKAITLVAEQDGILSEKITIYVYIPVETLDISGGNVNRGSIVDFNPIPNSHADYNGFIITEMPSCVNLVGNVLQIDKQTPAHTDINIEYKARGDRLDKTFSVQYKVNALPNDSSAFASSFIDSSTFSQQFSLKYGYVIGNGRSNIYVTRNNLQIEQASYTDIEILYNNQKLSTYGINNYTIDLIRGGNIAKATVLGGGALRIFANSGVSGKEYIQFRITVKDGTESMVLPTQTLYIFNKYTSADISDVSIKNQNTQLSIKFNSLASRVSDIKYSPISGSGYTLSSDGKFTVTNIHATYNPRIGINAKQYYNNTYFAIDFSCFMKLPVVWLDSATGDGFNYIINLIGVRGPIKPPSKPGYVFDGYDVSSSYPYIYRYLYYNKYGNFVYSMQDIPSSITLQAIWTPITYYVEFYYMRNDGEKCPVSFKDGSKGYQSVTCEYGRFYRIKEYAVTGGEFKHWRINDVIYNNGDEPTNTQSPSFRNLTTTNGQTVEFIGYCEWNSCVTSGTQITLFDGSQKAVEDLDGSEMLLVWNLYEGKFDVAPILFIDNHGESVYDITHLLFDDGTDVKIIYEHGFWDFNLNKYVYLRNDNAEGYIGHWFNKQYVDADGNLAYKRTQLVEVKFEKEFTIAWSPVTYSHLSYYVNGMLSVPANTEGLLNIFEVDAETMKYDQEKFDSDIAQYGLFDYQNDFAMLVPEEIFHAFNAKYFKISIAKGLLTNEELLSLIERYSKFFVSDL